MPERLQLADACELRTFHKGEAIVREGEPGEHFFVIRWGGAAITRTLSTAASRSTTSTRATTSARRSSTTRRAARR